MARPIRLLTIAASLAACSLVAPAQAFAGPVARTASAVPAPNPAAAPTIPDRTESVLDFGAVPDGRDDTAAIQAAIDATAQAGGGHLVFPAGGYGISVDPTTLVAINLRARVSLEAATPGTARLLLAPGQGNYASIFSATAADPADDVVLDGLVIDSNSGGNPVAKSSDLLGGHARFAVRVYAGHRLLIEHCQFTNYLGINTISINSEAAAGDATIRDNVFDHIGGGPVDFDHSTIYTHAPRVVISGNSFTSADGPGTYAARTAIETHGDDQSVTHNVITGYMSGMNITGVASSSARQLIAWNVIRGVEAGLHIWSYYSGGNTTQPGLRDVAVRDNLVVIDADGWTRTPIHQLAFLTGITVDPNSSAPLVDISITHNVIRLTDATYSTSAYAANYYEAAISLWQINNKPTFENLHVDGNIVDGSLSAGIYDNIATIGPEPSTISDNLIVAPSSYASAPLPFGTRSGIYLTGTSADLHLDHNVVTGPAAQRPLDYGVVARSTCTANCTLSSTRAYRAAVAQSADPSWTVTG